MDKINFFDSPVKILGGSILLVEAIFAGILAAGALTNEQRTWIICGMLSVLFLTIICAVIMHWINNTKTADIVSQEIIDKLYDYDIFISFPIAGIKNRIERSRINNLANKLEDGLKKIGYKKIFNASVHFSNNHEHQPPKIAAEIDLKAVDKSKNFLLIYPSKVATSALIELGYAMRGEKNIIICSKNINTLPFLARGFGEAFPNVSYLEYSDNKHLINMLIENNKDFFKN